VVTDAESAYYSFLKAVADKEAGTMKLIKTYELLILEDITNLLLNKVDIVEALLREYDCLHFTEQHANKALAKRIGLAKQKLIFYLSFVKSRWTHNFSQEVSQEFSDFRKTYI